MLQDLRCTNEKLMTFFLKKEHVEQLCEWAMTLNYQEDKNYDQCSRRATDVFVCNQQFSTLLSQSEEVQTFITNYLSQKEWDNSCTGHFQRIFIELNKVTKGEYKTRFPNFDEQILSHLDMFSIVEFLICLINQFEYYDFIEKLSEVISNKNQNSWNAAYTLRRSLRESKHEQYQYFISPQIIKNIENGSNNPNLATRLQILQYLSEVHEIGGDTSSIKVDAGPINATKGLQLNCVLTRPEDGFNLLFKRPLHWNTANKIGKMLTDLGAVKLGKLVASQDGLNRLGKSAREGTLNAQQMEIIRILHKKYKDNAKWIEAIPEDIRTKAELLTNRYGGDVPKVVVDASKVEVE